MRPYFKIKHKTIVTIFLVIKLLQKAAIYAKYFSLLIIQILYLVVASTVVSLISGFTFLLAKM